MEFTLDGINPAPIYKKNKDPHSGQVTPSADIRRKLAEDGKPVIVAFSRGKDSIAAMISLIEAGVDVIPVHMWRVPNLQFELDSLKYFEDFFQMKIWNLPHRDFWYYLREGVSMAPWQNSIVLAADIQEIPHDVFWTGFKKHVGLDPDDTWVADGIRAADSPMRRLAMVTHGPMTNSHTKFEGELYKKQFAHVVWDWKIADIRQCVAANDVKLPIDYDLFDRTFDGLDYRFTKPIREHLPEDFETIIKWFPAVEMEFMRYEWIR